MTPATDDVVRRKAGILAGFMEAGEATEFAMNGMVLDPAKFIAACQALRAVLPTPLTPAFTPPQVAPLTAIAAARVAVAKAGPVFASFYPPSTTFEMVEISR